MILRIGLLALSLFMPTLAVLCCTKKTIIRFLSLIGLCLSVYTFFNTSALIGLAIYTLLVIHALYYAIFSKDLNGIKVLPKEKLSALIIITTLITFTIFFSTFKETIRVNELEYVDTVAYDNGRQLFSSCLACHRLSKDNFVGPYLQGVYGREAGSVAGYDYSEGMKNAKFTWTDDNLKRFLKNQRAVIPDTRMIISPLDEAQVNDIVEYLKRQ